MTSEPKQGDGFTYTDEAYFWTCATCGSVQTLPRWHGVCFLDVPWVARSIHINSTECKGCVLPGDSTPEEVGEQTRLWNEHRERRDKRS